MCPTETCDKCHVSAVRFRYQISFRLVMQRSPGQGEGIGKSGHGIADPRFVDTALTRARYRALALSLVRERDRKRRRGTLERAALCVSLGLHLRANGFQVLAQA